MRARFALATLVLVAILALATAVRLLGVGYGLPHPLVSDEEVLIGGALRMAQTGQFIPTLDPLVAHQLYYPVGLPYLYLAVFAPVVAVVYAGAGFPGLASVPLLLADNLATLFLVARLTSVAMAVATVWVVYRLAMHLFGGPAAGLVAAALMAFSWFHVVLAQVARHWSATVLLIWLAVLVGVVYFERPSRRRAIAAALVSAAGFAVSFIGIFGYAGFVLAHLARFGRRALDRTLLYSMAVLAAGVVLTAVLHLPAISRLVGADPLLPVDDPKSVAGFLDVSWFYLRNLWYAEPVLLVGGLAGAFVAWPGRPRIVPLLLAAVVGYLAFLYLFMPQEDRYILPALPALALLAGAGAGVLMRAGRRPGSWRAGVVALVVMASAFAGWNAYTMARLMGAVDSRELAVAWIERNLPAEAALVVAMNPVKVTASRQGLRDQAVLDPETLDLVDRLRLDGAAGATRTGEFRAVHLNRLPDERLSDGQVETLVDGLRGAGYRYFVVVRRYGREPDDLWRTVTRLCRPLAQFDPAAGAGGVYPPDLRTTTLVHDEPVWRYSRLERLGPHVAIYDLGADGPVPTADGE